MSVIEPFSELLIHSYAELLFVNMLPVSTGQTTCLDEYHIKSGLMENNASNKLYVRTR